jgi:hypothetical protein
MARIRSRPSSTLESGKGELVDAVAKAIKDEGSEDGLVIFEVLSGSTNFAEIVVVWDRWSGIPADIRSKMVMEAYQHVSAQSSDALSPDQISTILPLTVDEAMEMGVLPYGVQCNVLQDDSRYAELKTLLRKEGAIDTPDGTELRLPTLAMAKEARDRLQSATEDWQPPVHWQISKQAGRIVDY